MNELNYDNKHFVSGTYKGFAVTHEKATLPLHATLHFDADSGTVSGEMEDTDSGSIDVAGTFNHSAPYDFKITRAGTTYNGFRQEDGLIGRYKCEAGKGTFKLKPQTILGSTKLSSSKEMSQEDVIQELIGMGFKEEDVREAIIVRGLSLAEATEELVNPDAEKVAPSVLIERLKGMGFPEDKVLRAVDACEGKEDTALSILLGDG
ncbi:hypothetical protein DIPPA_21198 [Diplonema papillatum]|nr:hypothetical protein DIPPA_21198 [Diplonema papillatum]